MLDVLIFWKGSNIERIRLYQGGDSISPDCSVVKLSLSRTKTVRGGHGHNKATRSEVPKALRKRIDDATTNLLPMDCVSHGHLAPDIQNLYVFAFDLLGALSAHRVASGF